MSVRQSLLAILAEGQQHGYQLRNEFEVRTGRTWPINVGQVYTTLNRLVRDGLVEEAARSDDGSVTYRLTYAGREEVDQWWSSAVDRGTPGRDEVAIKIALAVTAPPGVAVSVCGGRRGGLSQSRAVGGRGAWLAVSHHLTSTTPFPGWGYLGTQGGVVGAG